MKTTYEARHRARGIEQGERRAALRLMQAKFGPLPPEVQRRVEAMSSEALAQLQIDVLKRKPARSSAWTTEAHLVRRRVEVEGAGTRRASHDRLPSRAAVQPGGDGSRRRSSAPLSHGLPPPNASVCQISGPPRTPRRTGIAPSPTTRTIPPPARRSASKRRVRQGRIPRRIRPARAFQHAFLAPRAAEKPGVACRLTANPPSKWMQQSAPSQELASSRLGRRRAVSLWRQKCVGGISPLISPSPQQPYLILLSFLVKLGRKDLARM